MAVVAASLVVASLAHLSGNVHGRGEPFNARHAGVAEAIIAVVLGGGALALRRGSGSARSIGLASAGFAVAGFFVGLNFTARGGDLPDIAYHVTVLPVLVGTVVALVRLGRTDGADAVDPG
jgi:hypothetical protein